MSLEYLETLLELHEKWLLKEILIPVIVLNGDLDENDILNKFRKIEEKFTVLG